MNMRVFVLATAVSISLLSEAAWAEGPPADLTISAIAPLAISEADLGRPYSSGFEPLIGKEGKSVFPLAKAPRRIPVSAWKHEFLWFGSTLELSANVRALTVSGGASSLSAKRVAVWRAVQFTHAIEVDDTTEPRSVSGDGAFYVRRIYFGRVYDVIISGTESTFTADVRAELLAYGGRIDIAQTKYRLHTEIAARGLKPKAQAVFARTAEEVRAAYVEDKKYNAGKPVPVLIEYRRIPGAALDRNETIEWKEATPPGTPIARQRVLQVDAKNSDWSDTGLVAAEGDLIVGFADGKITWGWGSTAAPETQGIGGLDFRVGPDVLPAGKSWAVTHKAGPVKVRVRDNGYDDNKGEYQVGVLIVPASMFASLDCAVTDASGKVESDCIGIGL